MNFLTDFADQAVILPLVLAVAAVLALQKWTRGAVVWLLAIGGTFAVLLVLKLFFGGCTLVFGPMDLRSPSGHVGAATVVGGGLVVIFGGSRRITLLVAVAAALVMGLTRVVLQKHSLPEAVLGGTIGLLGAAAMMRLIGPTPVLRVRPMIMSAAFVLALFHGRHMEAEVTIHNAAVGLDWLPAWCQGTSQPR